MRRAPLCRPKLWVCLTVIASVPIYLVMLFLLFDLSSTLDMTKKANFGQHPPMFDPRNLTIEPKRMNNALDKKKRLRREHYRSIAEEVAIKWNLTSPKAAYLLEQQFYRANDYDPQTNFLYFYHIPKTGMFHV